MTSENRERMIRYPARKVNLSTELGNANMTSPRKTFAPSPREHDVLSEIHEEDHGKEFSNFPGSVLIRRKKEFDHDAYTSRHNLFCQRLDILEPLKIDLSISLDMLTTYYKRIDPHSRRHPESEDSSLARMAHRFAAMAG